MAKRISKKHIPIIKPYVIISLRNIRRLIPYYYALLRVSLFRGLRAIKNAIVRGYSIYSVSPNKKWSRLLFILCIGMIIFDMLIPLPGQKGISHFSTVVTDRKGTLLRAFISADEQWKLPPEKQDVIPEKLSKATLIFEDEWFYYHPGVNPAALIRAAFINKKEGRIVSGGSTITMQLTRIMRPKKRTYGNKIIEILQACKFEMHYSKKKLLAMYMIHAPYGGNVIGYKAASLRYFGKLPDELSWSEAAMLAVLPNAPGLISPVSDRDELIAKRDRLLKKMLKKGVFDEETYRLALREEVPEDLYRLPISAPHIAEQLKRVYDRHVITTTLDASIQSEVEQSITRHMQTMYSRGINNCAVLVADTKTGEILAYAGSQDYFDVAHQGQVDGIISARSAGSTLKPFLYALAMDDGLIVPDSLLKDVPVAYGSYSPENADERFHGLVRADEALTRSLNVPAVNLLYDYGIYNYYLFLKSAGITTLFRPSDDYGLTLIIGGAEVRPWDLAVLFRGLGNGGRFLPLTIIPDEPHEGHYPELLSPGACYLTLSILRDVKRPDAEYFWEQYHRQKPIAWKTGTSYGQRDAWAAGVSPQWTIVVWVGNFTGEGNKNISGAQCAGPLLFDIFSRLPHVKEDVWFSRPSDLESVEVCKDTGYAAGQFCDETIVVLKPKRAHSLEICPYHTSIITSRDKRYEVCSECWVEGQYIRASFLSYPSDIAQYLRESGHFVGTLPPHNPACRRSYQRGNLSIIYPQHDTKLWVPYDYDGTLQHVIMRAAHTSVHETLYWYIDGELRGTTLSKHSLPVKLTRGEHELVIVDSGGKRVRSVFFADLKKR